MVDAEYTYMNPGISVGALAMMLALNRDGQAVVANTYQCYLKDALHTLKQESDIILGNDCMFGMNNFTISISKQVKPGFTNYLPRGLAQKIESF